MTDGPIVLTSIAVEVTAVPWAFRDGVYHYGWYTVVEGVEYGRTVCGGLQPRPNPINMVRIHDSITKTLAQWRDDPQMPHFDLWHEAL